MQDTLLLVSLLLCYSVSSQAINCFVLQLILIAFKVLKYISVKSQSAVDVIETRKDMGDVMCGRLLIMPSISCMRWQ